MVPSNRSYLANRLCKMVKTAGNGVLSGNYLKGHLCDSVQSNFCLTDKSVMKVEFTAGQGQ